MPSPCHVGKLETSWCTQTLWSNWVYEFVWEREGAFTQELHSSNHPWEWAIWL